MSTITVKGSATIEVFRTTRTIGGTYIEGRGT